MFEVIGNFCKIPKGIEVVIIQIIFRLTLKDFDGDVLMLTINSMIRLHQLQIIGTCGVNKYFRQWHKKPQNSPH